MGCMQIRASNAKAAHQQDLELVVSILREALLHGDHDQIVAKEIRRREEMQGELKLACEAKIQKETYALVSGA